MTGKTHVLAGAAAGLAFVHLAVPAAEREVTTALLLTVAASIGSIFPDIDEPKSKMGRKVPIVSSLLKSIFGHRGITHGILLYALCYAAGVHFLDVKYLDYLRAFMCGVCSHLLLDMLNSSGIPLFWPVSKKFSLARIPLGGTMERGLAVVLGIGILGIGTLCLRGAFI